jgi:hypothetical protein
MGVVLFGREELGRYRILCELADDVQKGKLVSPSDVQVACGGHVEKQRSSTVSTVLRMTRGTRLDDLLRRYMHGPPASEGGQTARKELQVAIDAKTKRSPTDRHELRMRAFYVDMKPTADGWLRPSEITRQEALDAISDAVNDYSGERDRLRDEVIESRFPEMAATRRGMDPRPLLIPPRWPENAG